MIVDISKWTARNLWPLPNGDIAVRPGFTPILAAASGVEIAGGFSITNSYVYGGETWHYLLIVDPDESDRDAYVAVYDSHFNEIQRLRYSANIKPKVLNYAVVQDQILISAPGLPTVWGYVGSGLQLAKKVQGDNDAASALDVPSGLCISWAGSRVVMASGNSVYFSDPITGTGGDVRTFSAINQVTLPGGIHSLHTGDNGALFVCTTNGVYAIPEDAAATGQVVVANWQRVSDYKTIRHGMTCQTQGRVFGLTTKGYMLIDEKNGEEVSIAPSQIDTATTSGGWGGGDGLALPYINDYRDNTIIVGYEAGPIVSWADASIRYFHVHDLKTGFKSWWAGNDTYGTTENFNGEVVGVLTGEDGHDILLGSLEAYVVGSAFDTRGNIDNDSARHTGGYLGRVVAPPAVTQGKRRVLLHVEMSTTGMYKAHVNVNGDNEQVTTTRQSPAIGGGDADDWQNDGTVLYAETKMQTDRFDFGEDVRELQVELEVDGTFARIDPIVDFIFTGDE